VRRDVLKFALLNLLIAAHTNLGEGGGRLLLQCAPDDTSVRITIDVEFAPDRTPAGSDSDLQQAMLIAGALLAPSGGRIEGQGAGVSVILPRTNSV
jgi:hypothetical protein